MKKLASKWGLGIKRFITSIFDSGYTAFGLFGNAGQIEQFLNSTPGTNTAATKADWEAVGGYLRSTMDQSALEIQDHSRGEGKVRSNNGKKKRSF